MGYLSFIFVCSVPVYDLIYFMSVAGSGIPASRVEHHFYGSSPRCLYTGALSPLSAEQVYRTFQIKSLQDLTSWLAEQLKRLSFYDKLV